MEATMRKRHVSLFSIVFFAIICTSLCKESNDEADKWKKKDVRDYSDADVERLFDQWEVFGLVVSGELGPKGSLTLVMRVRDIYGKSQSILYLQMPCRHSSPGHQQDADEDELEEDELPPWKRPQPKIDLSSINPDDPESMLKSTKQGQTLMMFITVSGDPTEDETQTISQIWQSSLFNANINVQRYVVGSNRVLFLLADGSKAWEIKDYLVEQERCEVVTIEGKDYLGKAHPEYGQSEGASPKVEKKKKKKKKNKKAGNENTVLKDEL